MKRDYLVVETNGTRVAGVLKSRLSKTEAEAWAETVNSIEQVANPGFSAVSMQELEYDQRQKESVSTAIPSHVGRRGPVLHRQASV